MLFLSPNQQCQSTEGKLINEINLFVHRNLIVIAEKMIMFFTCVCLSVNRITQKLLKLKCTAFMKFYGVTGLDTIQ